MPILWLVASLMVADVICLNRTTYRREGVLNSRLPTSVGTLVGRTRRPYQAGRKDRRICHWNKRSICRSSGRPIRGPMRSVRTCDSLSPLLLPAGCCQMPGSMILQSQVRQLLPVRWWWPPTQALLWKSFGMSQSLLISRNETWRIYWMNHYFTVTWVDQVEEETTRDKSRYRLRDLKTARRGTWKEVSTINRW